MLIEYELFEPGCLREKAMNLAWRRNSTSTEEVARLKRLFPCPSWLTSERTSGHLKIVPTFPWIDIRQLPDGKLMGFFEIEASL